MNEPTVPTGAQGPADPADGRVDLIVDGAIAELHLNRPAKLNAFTLSMLAELEAHLGVIEASEVIRVVVLTSAGERAFTAGADINHFRKLSALRMWSEWIRIGHRVFDRLAGLRQPTIAAMDGNAFGGGLEIALACDLRVLAEDAVVGLTEVGIGTVPGWGGLVRLPQIIGAARAKKMVFTATPIDAATAEAWGLVTDVVPRAEVRASAFEIAELIAGRAPIAVQMSKQAIDANGGIGAALALEGLASAASSASDDFSEGVTAFRQKRPPVFPGTLDTPGPRTAHLDG